jgi:hypothetical protein
MRRRQESRSFNMLYQVLMRKSGAEQWRCAMPPTSDMNSARLSLQTVKRYNAGAMLIAAESLPELVSLTRRLRDTRVAQEYAPPNATLLLEGVAPPRAAPLRAASLGVDRRWELESGLGGDHDEPYSFEAPTSEATRLAWARLLARVHRQYSEQYSSAEHDELAS